MASVPALAQLGLSQKPPTRSLVPINLSSDPAAVAAGAATAWVLVAAADTATAAAACARGEGARVSGRSPTPWTHELVDGSTRSYLRGSLRMRRQRARGHNERARNAGGVLGVCGATRRGQGRGGEGTGRVKCGRRAAHACALGPACGRGRCARGGAGAGRGARTSASLSYAERCWIRTPCLAVDGEERARAGVAEKQGVLEHLKSTSSTSRGPDPMTMVAVSRGWGLIRCLVLW